MVAVAVELGLQLDQRGGGRLPVQPPFGGGVHAFVLAPGLRVLDAGSDQFDTELTQVRLIQPRRAPGSGVRQLVEALPSAVDKR